MPNHSGLVEYASRHIHSHSVEITEIIVTQQ